jgi:hypothetical protein
MIHTNDLHPECFELQDEVPRLGLSSGLLMALVIAVFRLGSRAHLEAARSKRVLRRV